jgi:DNA-binding NtrC family response regulator
VDEHRTNTIDPSVPSAEPVPVRLVVLAGPDAGLQVEVREGTVLVGTHPDCQVKLTDPGVSRRHLSLELTTTRVKANDLNSKNGTRYLGAKFTRLDMPLGASVELGSTTLAVLPLLRLGVLSDKQQLGGLLGRSVPMRRLFAQIEQVAATDASCLVRGETGTGKELVARTLHALSSRSAGPLIAVDCGSITSSLVSSVLFGHAYGAFTGAVKDSMGLIEAANGGTLFLDEVASLPADVQPVLLRVLESRSFQRVGEARTRTADFRLVAATTRDLEQEAKKGRFRSDLYYRLASITLELAPLRDRPDDIALLAQNFANAAGATTPLPAAALAGLAAWRWPGNVRELRNAVERAVTFGEAPQLEHPSAAKKEDFHQARDKALAAFERSYLEALLTKNRGVASAVAREAGIARSYLYKLFETHGLSPEDYR